MSQANALPAADVRDVAPLFAALGDETRLKLLGRLSAGGPRSITELCARSRVSRQAITKHLEVLADARLVSSSWRGRERIWQLAPDRLADAHACLEQISKQWDEALSRLQQFVEE